jgi:hypothetical protein
VLCVAWIGFGAWLIGPWFGIPLATLLLVGFDYLVSAWHERGDD